MQFNSQRFSSSDAKAVSLLGTERTYDAGVSWYLNKKHLKVMLPTSGMKDAGMPLGL